MPGLEVVREVDERLRAADVQRLVALLGGGHVVDRRQVEDVVDLAAMLVDPRLVDAELGRLEVADDRVHAALAAEAADDLAEALEGPLADQHVDVAVPLEQPLEQIASDEARRPSDEVRRHACSSRRIHRPHRVGGGKPIAVRRARGKGRCQCGPRAPWHGVSGKSHCRRPWVPGDGSAGGGHSGDGVAGAMLTGAAVQAGRASWGLDTRGPRRPRRRRRARRRPRSGAAPATASANTCGPACASSARPSSSGRPCAARAARRSASIVLCGKPASPSAISQRARQVLALGHDLRQQAHVERLARVDDAPGQDQVERAAEADDARQPLGAAVDQRDAPAPLGEAELRARGRDAQVAPQRQLEPAGQAPAGDRGDRRLARRQAREPERALLRRPGAARTRRSPSGRPRRRS